MNARAKGLLYVREVHKILEGMGHICDGPFYKTAYFGGKQNAVHFDVFGLWDLVSWYQGRYYMHQVSTLPNKAIKVKAIQSKGQSGWVWCRIDRDRRVGYRIFFVLPGKVEEGQAIFKGKTLKGGEK